MSLFGSNELDSVVPETSFILEGCRDEDRGDGRCDDVCNTAEFGFDNGDCCLATCHCGVAKQFGTTGFHCRDPSVEPKTAAFIEVDVAAVQQAHNTSSFPTEARKLHVRRGGAPFEFIIKGANIADRTPMDQLSIVLHPMDDVTTVISTTIVKPAAQPGAPACFLCSVNQTAPSVTCPPADLSVHVAIPIDTPVGLYGVSLLGAEKVQAELVVYVLFNPYHEHDPVYLPSEYLLEEHLNSASAGVCTGRRCVSPIVWSIDQFTPAAIATAIFLLGSLPVERRAHPQHVARHLAWKLNTEVMEGKWTEPYTGGHDPVDWTGSAEILQQFLSTKAQVKYAQCWVFSGVLATLMRALGVPTRIVSGEHVAIEHSKPFQARMKRFWTLEPDKHLYALNVNQSDGMWYYHVWNDVWMAREDLVSSPVGWQALDATPQKWAQLDASSPLVLGPASLTNIKALGAKIRNGFFDDKAKCTTAAVTANTSTELCDRDVAKFISATAEVSFDEAFISSEVNADKMEYMRPTEGAQYTLDHYVPDAYAMRIMTQKPALERGSMINVLCDYKTKCGVLDTAPGMHMVYAPLLSPDLLGTGLLSNPLPLHGHPDAPAKHKLVDWEAQLFTVHQVKSASVDVLFHLEQPALRILSGRNVKLKLRVSLAKPLAAGEVRTVNVGFTGFTHHSLGSQDVIFGRTSHTAVLSSQTPHATLSTTIPARAYHRFLTPRRHDSLSFALLATVVETQQVFTTLDNRPSVQLALPAVGLRIKRGARAIRVQAKWRNPQTNKALCGCVMKVHLVGTEHTTTWQLGCVGNGKQAKLAKAYAHAVAPAQAMQTKLAANAVVTCHGGAHATGFVSE